MPLLLNTESGVVLVTNDRFSDHFGLTLPAIYLVVHVTVVQDNRDANDEKMMQQLLVQKVPANRGLFDA